MKKILLISTVVILSNFVFAFASGLVAKKGGQHLIPAGIENNDKLLNQSLGGRHEVALNRSINTTSVVNSSDTVLFDLANAVVVDDYVDIPVSILTTDTINALDFSLKFNFLNLVFDSILNLTTYIQPYSFYNTIDSTLRVTSNSLQRYDNNVPLMAIRFIMLAGHISELDLNIQDARLNGDACSFRLTDALLTGVAEPRSEEDKIRIYPNPTTEKLFVEAPEDVTLELFNSLSEKIAVDANIHAHQKQEIFLTNFSKGIYFVKLYNEHFVSTSRVIVQ